MPITYRHSFRPASGFSSESDTSLDSPSVTDVDDSIVLSDLVRTGEASRLRRRGAMRLDHGHANHGSNATANAAVALANRPQSTWAFPFSLGLPRTGRHAASSDPPSNSGPGGAPTMYTLICGAEDLSPEAEGGSTTPLQPSALPLYPPPPSSHTEQRSRRKLKRTNGCGTIIHTRAFPRRRLGVWTARTSATNVVIGMDTCYFDRAPVVQFVKNSCGCIREGVGCAVCGNPLGMRYKPCAVAVENLFRSSMLTPVLGTSSAAPHRNRQPPPSRARNSPAATGQHSSSSDSCSSASSPFSLYTFFSSSVSSSPAFVFPSTRNEQPAPASPVPSPPLSRNSVDEDERGIYLDGALTASPLPAAPSDISEEGVWDAQMERIGFNHGISTEPSTDKSGSEMLAPER